MAFNVDKSIISQSAGKDAAAIAAALVSSGQLDADNALEFFAVARAEMVGQVIDLAGGEPEDAPAPAASSGGGRSFSRGRTSGGGGRADDHGAGVVIKFGKHQGKTIEAVYGEAPDYLDWLVENATSDFLRGKVEEFLAAQAA